MANIFSGIFQPGSSGQKLAHYQQRLKDYQDAKDAEEQTAAVKSTDPRLKAVIEGMSPERQNMMLLARGLMLNPATFDKGTEILGKMTGQRGTTIADIIKAEETRKTQQLAEVERRKTQAADVPDIIKTTKAYMGEENWNNATDAERQKAIRDVKRQRQYVNTGTAEVDPFAIGDPAVIEIDDTQAELNKKRGITLEERLSGFYSGVNKMEQDMQGTAHQRKLIQQLYNTAEGNTGWYALAASIPDIKSEGGSREWQQIRDTVVANIGLDKILDLKASSAQGATGLGALNEKELEMLQKHKGSLEQANSPEALKAVLLQMDKDMSRLQQQRMRLLGTERKWFNRNRRRIGEDPSMPDFVPASQEYLFSGKEYVPVQGTSPLDDSDKPFDPAAAVKSAAEYLENN